MENQENEDFFGNLPREELQSLCKKHGLSTNETNTELAKLLVSYYKSMQLSSSTGDVDTRRPPSKGTPEGFGCSNDQLREITCQQPISGSICDEKASKLKNEEPPESSGAGNIPQIQNGTMKFGVFPSDNNFVSSNGSSVEVPSASFEYYVMSEEGINLCVDLNSSPSNWVNRLKSQVCIHPKIQKSESRVLHHELKVLEESAEQMKASFLKETGVDFQTNGDPNYIKSSPTSIARASGIKHPGGTERMLRSSAVIPSNDAIEMSSLSSVFKPDTDLKNPIVSCSEYCLGNVKTVSLGSDVPNISQTTETGEFLVDSKSGDSELINSSENQSKSDSISPENNSEMVPKLTSISSEIIPIWTSGSSEMVPILTSVSVTLENNGGVGHRPSASDSVGMQLSEVAGHCEDTLCSPRQSYSAPEMYHEIDELLTANGGSLKGALDRNTCSDPFYACAEEWGGSKPINERESSECSQIKNLLKRTNESSNTLDYEGLQSKRQHTNSEDQESSATELASKVLPRRSSRLVSK